MELRGHASGLRPSHLACSPYWILQQTGSLARTFKHAYRKHTKNKHLGFFDGFVETDTINSSQNLNKVRFDTRAVPVP